MRMKALLTGDVHFQFKYGFYFLYVIFSSIYIGLLLAFPVSWREKAAILMVFSDPATMGLYFMGAIVLFEKSERVLDSLAVSPVKPMEYVLSKLCSISVISTVAGLVIGFFGGGISNSFYFIAGLILCSSLFSSIGLMIASSISTLNQFILATVPAELLINVPAAAYLFGWKKSWLLLHPGVCMMELCTGGPGAPSSLGILFLWALALALLAGRATGRMFQVLGGMKL